MWLQSGVLDKIILFTKYIDKYCQDLIFFGLDFDQSWCRIVLYFFSSYNEILATSVRTYVDIYKIQQ